MIEQTPRWRPRQNLGAMPRQATAPLVAVMLFSPAVKGLFQLVMPPWKRVGMKGVRS